MDSGFVSSVTIDKSLLKEVLRCKSEIDHRFKITDNYLEVFGAGTHKVSLASQLLSKPWQLELNLDMRIIICEY